MEMPCCKRDFGPMPSFLLGSFCKPLNNMNVHPVLCPRLQLQQGPLPSLNLGRLMMSPQPKSLKPVFQQVTTTGALASPWLLISKTPYVLKHTSAFFISLIPAFCICPFLQSNATTAVVLFKISFYFLLLLLLRPLVVLLSAHLHLFFMLVSLRLSSFYTVASEECGHRRLER